MSIRRITRCVLWTLMIFSLILSVSCSATAPAAKPSPAPTQALVTVQIIAFEFSPTVNPIFSTLEENFNSTHQDIQIQIKLAGNDQFPGAFRTTPPPDICLGINLMGLSNTHDDWLDLTTYIETDNYDMTRFVGPTLKIFSEGQDGIPGLPFVTRPSVIFYNLEMFDRAGLAYPPAEFGALYADGYPWDYAKLVEIAQALTLDASSTSALSSNFNPGNIEQYGFTHEYWENALNYAAKFGADSNLGISEDLKTAALNTQQFKDAMQWDLDSIWNWHISPNYDVFMAAEKHDVFGSRQVAMYEGLLGYSFGDALPPKDLRWNIAAIPQGSDGVIDSLTDSTVISILKNSRYPDEAWEVVKWLFESDLLKTMASDNDSLFYGVPEFEEYIDDWRTAVAKNYPQVNPQTILDTLVKAEPVNWGPWRPNNGEARKVMEGAHEKVIRYEDQDVEMILEKANADLQVLLDAYWKQNP
jgi:multiple sugar transport system substrate-binding protein